MSYSASDLFPKSASAAAPTPVPTSLLAAAPAEPAPAAAPITSAPAATPPPQPQDIAQELFCNSLVPTKGFVHWQEPPAQPGQMQLDVSGDWETTPEAIEERQRVANHMAAVGVGPSLMRELWGDVVTATARPVTMTRDAAMAELQRTYGAQTGAKIDLALHVVEDMEARYPGTVRHLEQTGLGNDPAFIKKLVAMASNRGRR